MLLTHDQYQKMINNEPYTYLQRYKHVTSKSKEFSTPSEISKRAIITVFNDVKQENEVTGVFTQYVPTGSAPAQIISEARDGTPTGDGFGGIAQVIIKTITTC